MSENVNAQEARQQRWEKLMQQVEQYGKEDPIEMDEGIKETVAALMLHGFTTNASCFGHLDHGTPYPWVGITHPIVRQSLDDPSFSVLNKRVFGDNDESDPTLTPEELEEHRRVQDAMKAAVQAERQKLLKLLEEFYTNHEALPGIRLAVSSPRAWLRSEETIDIDTETIRTLVTEDALKTRLDLYRKEIEAFTDFLKQK